MNFISELKRRNVIRMAGLYLVGAWLITQVAATLLPVFEAPAWAMKAVVGLLAVGFLPAMVFSWVFELTPEGLKRDAEVPASESIAPQTARRMERVFLLLLALALGFFAFDKFVLAPRREAALVAATTRTVKAEAGMASKSAISEKSIAVLPFVNMSADKDNEYFVAGMQDLILTKLAEIGDLKVISRTSTMKYRSRPENLRQVGAELGVAHVLEGSVQRQGDAVLINVQLVDAATDAHLWAESYQRTLDNVFGVEGEVAGKVADALKARLSPLAAARLETSLGNDPVADDFYLRAEYFTARGDTNFDTAQYKLAVPLYRQAIARAPAFPLAMARLSYAESVLAWFGGGGEDVRELQTDARRQAEQVLAQAPELPEAQLAMGFSNYYGRGDYAAALRNFQAALKLRPNDDKALTAQGYVLRRQGHFDDALDSLARAQVRDPRNSALALTQGETLMMLFRYPEAEAALQRALALDPTNVQARFRLSGSILLSRGDIPAALATAQGDEPKLRVWRMNLLTYQRNYREALALLDSVPDTPDNFDQSNYGQKNLMRADLYRLLGDAAQARTLYARAMPQERARLDAIGPAGIRAAEIWAFVARAELGLGNAGKALAALSRSYAFVEQARDYADGPSRMAMVAATYAKACRADLAVPMLARALDTPGIGVSYSPTMLWLDPALDPIRSDAGFQALLRKYAKYKPVAGIDGGNAHG